MRTWKKITDHVHLPVQSGSDRILAAMKRGYTVLEYKSIIRKITPHSSRHIRHQRLHYRFSGESEQDFIKTLDLVDDIDFDFSFSFIYSSRPGTPAAKMPDDCPMAEKNRVWRGCRKNWTPTAVDSAKRWWGGKRKFWWKGNPKNERVKCKAEPPIIAW